MDAAKFPFGTQYLRGMSPLPQDWARDFKAMRSLGFNTVRAWLVWGVLEPSEGEVDFDYVERFLDLAGANGMTAGLLFHLHGCPEWAVRKHSKCWYVDEEGRAFEPSARSNTPSGGWPGLCPDNQEVKELEARFIEAVASRFGEHPALGFWEPVNEPHMWIDFTKSPAMSYCYCKATRAEFRLWLKAKYGELGALEEAWGRRFSCWEDVRPPTWRMNLSDWCDWREFTADNVAALVARRAALIERCSTRPIIGHAWGGGCVACGSLGAMAFDDWRNARPLERWGYSAFPDSVASTPLIGLGSDATRSASAGKVFWQSELGVGDYGSSFAREGRVRPELLSLWSWESLRHGAKGLLYWQFRKELFGSESGAFGLVGYGGEPTASSEAAAKIGRVLDENAELFLGASPAKAEVALLFSFQTYLLEWAQRRDCKLSVDSLSGFYRTLWEANVPVDIVHEDFSDASALSAYKLVVAPMPLALSAKARASLKGYVESGGTLLAEPCLCAYDQSKRHDFQVPGGGFRELFGCEELDVSVLEGRSVKLSYGGFSGELQGSHFKALLRPLPGSEAIGFFEDGSPAIASKPCGLGRAVLSGVNLGLAASCGGGLGDDLKASSSSSSSGAGVAKRIFNSILTEAGVAAPLNAPSGIAASVLRGADEEDLLVALNMLEGEREASIEPLTGLYSSFRDLLSWERGKIEGSSFALRFAPLGCRVLALTKRA